MRKYILLIVFIVLIVYIAGTLNFYLGSNSAFFDTAFDNGGSKWHCSKHNVEAVVPNVESANYMELIDLETGEKYTLSALDDFTVELYKGTSIDPWLYEEPLYRTTIETKKRWGKVYKFIIKNIDDKCWYKPGNSSMVYTIQK